MHGTDLLSERSRSDSAFALGSVSNSVHIYYPTTLVESLHFAIHARGALYNIV